MTCRYKAMLVLSKEITDCQVLVVYGVSTCQSTVPVHLKNSPARQSILGKCFARVHCPVTDFTMIPASLVCCSHPQSVVARLFPALSLSVLLQTSGPAGPNTVPPMVPRTMYGCHCCSIPCHSWSLHLTFDFLFTILLWYAVVSSTWQGVYRLQHKHAPGQGTLIWLLCYVAIYMC